LALPTVPPIPNLLSLETEFRDILAKAVENPAGLEGVSVDHFVPRGQPGSPGAGLGLRFVASSPV